MAVGTRVMVLSDDGMYYLGTVREVYGATCSVKVDTPIDIGGGFVSDGIFCACAHLIPIVEVA